MIKLETKLHLLEYFAFAVSHFYHPIGKRIFYPPWHVLWKCLRSKWDINARDANLWRSKIWRLTLFHYPHPSSLDGVPAPRRKLPQPPMGMAWDIIWSLTWSTYYQNSRSLCWCRQNLCQRLNTCKNASETVLRIRRTHILRGKWATSQTKAQKRSKDDFILEIWWPVRENGRSVSYPGDSRIIRKSWHVWNAAAETDAKDLLM